MLLHVDELLQGIDYLSIKNKTDFYIKKVVTRSKGIGDETLFFHMRQRNFDFERLGSANRYILVTENVEIFEQEHINGIAILVKDVRKAYWDFIEFYRQQFDIPVIGITGTCGKTTTKEMLTHILRKDYKVQGTFMSQNGLHLNLQYLLGLKKSTDAAVFEMGVAYQGNIKNSGRYFKPTIGITTNIGEAHLEGCKTLEKYISAKGEMLEVLPDDGTLIINGDDANIKKLPLSTFKGEIITFGLSDCVDFRATQIQYEENGMTYQLQAKNCSHDVFIPSFGDHNVYNSLAAIAAANLVGASIKDAIERLRDFKELARHVKPFNGLNGSLIIDDTWSCNPSSVKSGLEVLKSISKGKKEVLVLGKMQRLGRQLKEQHMKVGKALMDMGGVDYLVAIGGAAGLTGEKAIELGMKPESVLFVNTAEELEKALDALCREDSAILLKMSLGKMEKSYRTIINKYRKKSKG